MKNFYSFLFALLISGLGYSQISEDFNEGLDTSYITGTQTLSSGDWTMTAVYQEFSSNSRGGSGYAARINDDTNNANLTSPAMNGAGTVTFWYRELNNGGGNFALQTSTDGVNYTTLTTQAFSGSTYTEFSYDINDPSSNLTIRILSDDQSGHLIIDDFEVTALAVGGPNNPDIFSASPSSSTQIDLAYDDNTSEDNVIILFNTDNSFTTPSGAPTAVGTSFAGGTILVNNNGTGTYNHTGLSENTTYYYMAYSYDGAEYSTGLSGEATTPCSAISSFPFTEGFESGTLPSCWHQEFENGNNDWVFQSGNSYNSVESANTGNYNALFFTEDYSSDHTKLITPPLDLSGLSNPSLSFWHTQPEFLGDQDELRIYYKNSTSASWTLIPGQEYLNSITSWTQEIDIPLPNPSSEYYIAFDATSGYGDGITIDDIEVYEAISSDNDSEVYESSPQISATSIVAADVTTSGSSEDVFSFIIEDFGTSDGLPTNVTTMRFVPGANNSTDWSNAIAGITLYDENLINYTPTTTITDTEIILNFASPIVIANGTALEFFLGVYLNTTNIIDNSVIQIKIDESSSGFSSDNSGSGFSDPFLLGDIIGNNITINVEATEIIFSEQPTETIVNEIMDSVSITAVDTNGNIDLDYDFDVSITSTGTLSNTPVTLAAANGVATFSNLTHTAIGTALTLTASDDLFTDVVSDAFNIIEVPVEPVTLWHEPFTDNSLYTVTLGGEGYGGSSDYFHITDGSNIGESYSGNNGNFFAAQDIDDNGWNNSASPSQLTWSGIDISAYESLNFSGYFASNGGGIDSADYTLVEFRIDGGTWTNLLAFENDGTTYNTSFLEDTNFDGHGDGILLNGTFTEFTKTIASTGSIIDIRITIAVDSDNEEIALEDFSLTGQLISVETTYTYNDGIWSPSNPDGTSTASENIIIESGNATIYSDTNINSITVNPGAGLTIDSDVTLTVNNVLLLESTSTSYSSLIVDGTVTGTVNYSRYINSAAESGTTTGDNDLISAPLTGQTFGDFKTTNPNILSGTIGGVGPYYLFGPFDTTNNEYVLYYDTDNDASTLDAGVGYRTGSNGGGAYTFTGNVETSNVTVSIHNETQSNWNLIGNPYPSYILLSDFLEQNSSLFGTNSSGVYGYNGQDSNTWVVWNNAYALANPGATIAPGQGFYVSSLNADSMVTFNSTSRTFGNADDFIAGRSSEVVANLGLSLNSSSSSFVTDFYFTEFSTQGLDSGYDSSLYTEVTPSFALYSHLVTDNTGVPMAIQSLGETDYNNATIPLGVNANQGEQITFSITTNTIPANIDIYLEDTVENTSTLLTYGDYTLTPNTTLNGTGRFFLNFVNSTLSTINNDLETLNIYTNESDETIVIQGQLTEKTTVIIYDIQGRIIKTTQLVNTKVSQSIDISSLSNSVYIVELKNNSQTKTQKVVLR